MNKRYEALLALDTQGKEDSIKDIIDRIEKLLKAEGAEIEQVQRLEKRDFAYETKHLSSGYYVNFIFEMDSQSLDKVRSKLKLDDSVILQNYAVLKKKAAEASA